MSEETKVNAAENANANAAPNNPPPQQEVKADPAPVQEKGHFRRNWGWYVGALVAVGAAVGGALYLMGGSDAAPAASE